MTPRIWLESSVVIWTNRVRAAHKRAGQHAVEPLHSSRTKEPDFRELRPTIGVVRVRLVCRHIERRLCCHASSLEGKRVRVRARARPRAREAW